MPNNPQHGGARKGAGRKVTDHGRADASLNLRVQTDLVARLDAVAERRGTTRSALAVTLLRRELARTERGAQ